MWPFRNSCRQSFGPFRPDGRSLCQAIGHRHCHKGSTQAYGRDRTGCENHSICLDAGSYSFFALCARTDPKSFGKNIARFKVLANKLAAVEQVFAEGFNDQILKVNRSLEILYGYLRDNPRRLAVRRAVPNYFRRIDNLTIGGMKVQAYGNLQLLDNPFKEQVIVHRADDARRREHNRQSWLYNAANGGVLVSPFISPAEKSIRREAESYGSRFILITSEVFGERYKPAGHDFELCESGRLLIIAAQPRIPEAIISRETCLTLNALAERIVMHP